MANIPVGTYIQMLKVRANLRILTSLAINAYLKLKWLAAIQTSDRFDKWFAPKQVYYPYTVHFLRILIIC